MSELIYKSETYAIRGAIFEVYKSMGCGFLEAVYQECLEKEFIEMNIPYESQVELSIFYKGNRLERQYCIDFVCFGKILVELKSVRALTPEHNAQILNYLKGTGMKIGLLVNFGHYPNAQVERFVL